jgi:protein-tyrosine-phosphatase
MAIYHFSGQMIGRSGGSSATASAAYRAGQEIADRTTGQVFDYSRKGGVHGASILAPDHAPSWVFDRSELWNQVEESETRVNSQLAREFNIGIPIELNDHDRIELVRQFVQEQFVDLGMVADVAFHDFASHNPHCHVMLPTREVGQYGFTVKSRAWNSHALMDKWREAWADHANSALEKAGFDVRIDHRSYEDREIDLIPTKHMGPAVAALEKRGVSTRIGDYNRQVDDDNAEHMDTLVALDVEHEYELAALDSERADVMSEIERIRQDALAQPSTSGTINVSDHRNDIADRADEEASRFETGMAASIADQYKARLFLKVWSTELDPSLLKHLKWVDVDARALTLKTGEQIVDRGDSVSLSKGSDDAIKAAVSMAKAKGWENVRVTGSDDFQLRAALALEDAGIRPNFNSEIAKERFSEEMGERTQSAAQKPEPEPEPEPRPSVDVRGLEDRVLVATMNDPMPKARHGKRDAKVLADYATRIWSFINDGTAPEVLGKLFVETLRDQARVEGYSDDDLETAQILRYLPDEPDQAVRPSDPMTKGPSRRKYYPDSGDKPSGT